MNRNFAPLSLEGAEKPLHPQPGRLGTLPPARATSGEADADNVIADLERVTAALEREIAHSSPTATPEQIEHPDAESLESHLSRFMERMTGKKVEPVAPAPELGAAPQPASPAKEAIKRQSREPAQAPECREQLAALRKLANENARNAVTLHACRGLMGQTRMALVGAAAASLFSSSLAAIALGGHSLWARLCALLTCALALFLACRFFWLYRQLRARAAQLLGSE